MEFPADLFGSVTDQATQRQWSGAEIMRSANQRTQILHDLGVGPGDRVVLSQIGHGGFFADLLAVWSCGAAAAIVNPGLKPDEIDAVVGHIGPKLALVADDVDEARSLFDVPVADLGAGRGPTKVTVAPTDRHESLDDPALILFTSGTTGTPKGVVHSFRSLLARFNLNAVFIGRSVMARTLCTLPVHFGHGLIGNCLTPLLSGGDVVLMRGSDPRAIASLGDLIDEHHITFMSSVPTLWRIALKAAPRPEPGVLKRVHIGSAPLSADLWRKVVSWSGTDDVVNMYGITETANWIGGASAAEFEPQDGLVGRVWGGTAGVLGEDGQIRSAGEGEIVIQCPSLMQGYFGLDELNARTLLKGWFRTGDVGRIEDGVLRLTGRQKHEINRAGLKVHPEDVDILLERHPGVAEACTFGAPDPVAGETVAVAVVLEAGQSLDDVKSWCAERLVREKNPERWFVLDAIPRTDRGKINRDSVAQSCLTPQTSARDDSDTHSFQPATA